MIQKPLTEREITEAMQIIRIASSAKMDAKDLYKVLECRDKTSLDALEWILPRAVKQGIPCSDLWGMNWNELQTLGIVLKLAVDTKNDARMLYETLKNKNIDELVRMSSIAPKAVESGMENPSQIFFINTQELIELYRKLCSHEARRDRSSTISPTPTINTPKM